MPAPWAVKGRREPAGLAGAKEVEISRQRARSAQEADQALLARTDAPKPAKAATAPLPRLKSCQFPIWPHDADHTHPDFGKYCGAKVHEVSYCAKHHLICWQESKPAPSATRPGFRIGSWSK